MLKYTNDSSSKTFLDKTLILKIFQTQILFKTFLNYVWLLKSIKEKKIMKKNMFLWLI